uniref:Uncharacterized protein n=1 Tax=Leersia perrieri TaxID=77586 RepID=A0A0D9XIQ4_9ORYZ
MNDVVCFVSIHPAITDSSSQIPDFKYLCSHRHAIFQLKGIALNMSFQPKCERRPRQSWVTVGSPATGRPLCPVSIAFNATKGSVEEEGEATVLPDLQNPLPKAFEELQLRGHMTKT